MKIEYRTGNLFEGDDVVFLTHQVNSRGKMASGFAKELVARYPGNYTEYKRVYDSKIAAGEPHLKMGSIIPYITEDGRTIFNIVGQCNYGYDGKRYTSYDALAEGFMTLDTLAPDIGMDKLFMPLIGSVLAGGSWMIISAIIERHSVNYTPVVYLLDGVIPTT